jgi:hypothetical protein
MNNGCSLHGEREQETDETVVARELCQQTVPWGNLVYKHGDSIKCSSLDLPFSSQSWRNGT